MQDQHDLTKSMSEGCTHIPRETHHSSKMKTMGWTQKQTASYYSSKGYGTQVSQVNISCWMKDKQKMETHVGDGGINPTTCCIHSVQHPELEAALALWIKQ